MKITTAWSRKSPRHKPRAFAARPENPDKSEAMFYEDTVLYERDEGRDVAELVVEVPDEAVRALFDVPEVEGKVTG